MIGEKVYAPVEAPAPVAVEQETAPGSVPVPWGLAKRILFRFVCSYFFLYIFPFPVDYLPWVDETAAGWYQNLWNAFGAWVGKHVFGVTITVFTNGSGDTTFNYVQLFCFVVLAAVATLVWSLLDRKRTEYARLYEWLRVWVRFYLAAAMVSYGSYKIFPSQMPAPSLDRLLQPIGDASPMGLLWTFIGASRSYELFSGASEMLGGLLLLGRRTTLLGALVSIGVLSNVVMLNFSYDVPVKIFSSHLLLMAIFLVLPDARRLAGLFLFNRAVPAADIRPLFRRVWLNRVALACRTLLVLGIAVFTLFQSYRFTLGERAPNSSQFYGIWNVEEFIVDGQVRPPLITDEDRWERVIFAFPGTVSIQLMDQHRLRYRLHLNPQQSLLELTKLGEPDWKAALTYEQIGPGRLALEGTLDGKKIRAGLRLAKSQKFLLVDRGFHWINEAPFNR
jgi:hypothetical protein